jgi:hypothetical protein
MGECFALRRGVRVGGLGERVSSGIPVEEEKGPEKGEAGGVGTIEVGDGPAAIGTAISTGEGWLGTIEVGDGPAAIGTAISTGEGWLVGRVGDMGEEGTREVGARAASSGVGTAGTGATGKEEEEKEEEDEVGGACCDCFVILKFPRCC